MPLFRWDDITNTLRPVHPGEALPNTHELWRPEQWGDVTVCLSDAGHIVLQTEAPDGWIAHQRFLDHRPYEESNCYEV